ncbi:hypothetical protein ACFQBY_15720 [Promicromonospora citrea]|uniref:NmrA-like family protein n=1 Tax=Promicromonospora citrea TaxID=43677 RepID=A0A8H9GGK3_9MICO|nr:hypothetical protein [Promicromonospora citrea]NNH52732.1 hypothetical protein [Promicromonospora citrea]GGM16105.1 hypothetical protein GCM10010102_09650 [Promicromonospora citrea]
MSASYPAHLRRVIDANVRALRDQPTVRRVVTLSGWAANHDGARGPVWGLRRLEDAIDALGVPETVHLRPGWFMENALPLVEEIRATGRAHGLIPGDLPLPAIATRDIGAVAADVLTGQRVPPTRVLQLQGPADITLEQLTAVAAALGMPDAAYVRIDAETMRDALLADGFSEHMAAGTTAMTLDVAERRIAMRQPRGADTCTPTTIEAFVRDLVARVERPGAARG